MKTPFTDAIETRVRTKSGAGSFDSPSSRSLPSAPSDMGRPGGQPILQTTDVATPVQGLPSLRPEGRIFKIPATRG